MLDQDAHVQASLEGTSALACHLSMLLSKFSAWLSLHTFVLTEMQRSVLPHVQRERERERERETLHLFQPPRADQMPDPLQGQDYHHSIYLGTPGCISQHHEYHLAT